MSKVKISKYPFGKKAGKGKYYYPIEIAVLVPSTTPTKDKQGRDTQKFIGTKQFNRRVEETKRKLISLFGGHTTVRGKGGFYSDELGKVISEKVAKVTSFAERDKHRKNKRRLLEWIKIKKRQWQQESIGIESEGDLHYY